MLSYAVLSGQSASAPVLDLIGRHVNWTGFWPINWLCCTDTAVVDSVYRDLVEMVADGTLSARVDRDMLLDAGEREAALHQLDAAWDDYDHMGAFARRAGVQRVMRQAGARRAKWVRDHNDPQPRPLTEAERRVAYLVADGHTHKRLPGRLAYPLIPWGPTFARYIRSLESSRACSWPMRCANAAN